MNKNLHNIDQYFKEGIEGHWEEPDERVWGFLDSALDKQALVDTQRKYRFLKRAVAAMLIISASVAFGLWLTYAPQHTGNDISKPPESNQPAAPVELSHDTEHSKTESSSEISTSLSKGKTDSAASSVNRIATASVDKVIGKESGNESDIVSDLKYENKSDNKFYTGFDEDKFKLKIKIKESPVPSSDNKVIRLEGASQKSEKIKRTAVVGRRVRQLSAPKQFIDAAGEKNIFTHELEKEESIIPVKAIVQEQAKEAIILLPRHLAYTKTESDIFSPRATASVTVNLPALRSKRSFKSSFSLMPFMMPERADLRLREGSKEHYEDDKDIIERGETVKSSNSYGAQVNLNLSQKLSLISGIGVSTSSSTILPRSIYARPHRNRPGQPPTNENNYKISCASGYAYLSTKTTGASVPASGDSIQGLTSTSRVQHIVVPIGVRYMFGAGKFGIGGMAGFNLNLLSNANLDVNYNEPTGQKEQATVKIEGVRKGYLSAFIGLSLEYDLTKRLSLQLSPIRTMGISSINQNTPASSKKTATGGQIGLRIKL